MAPDQSSFIRWGGAGSIQLHTAGGAPDLPKICANLASCRRGGAGLGCMDTRQWLTALSQQGVLVMSTVTQIQLVLGVLQKWLNVNVSCKLLHIFLLREVC